MIRAFLSFRAKFRRRGGTQPRNLLSSSTATKPLDSTASSACADDAVALEMKWKIGVGYLGGFTVTALAE